MSSHAGPQEPHVPDRGLPAVIAIRHVHLENTAHFQDAMYVAQDPFQMGEMLEYVGRKDGMDGFVLKRQGLVVDIQDHVHFGPRENVDVGEAVGGYQSAPEVDLG